MDDTERGRRSKDEVLYLTPVSQQGCICPPGAENTCRGMTCPRNPPMVQKWVGQELVWVRS
jgi:hypothetical protein